ncbi:hypothetical protein BU16DRAFT_579353 [Lophium mytilinum]|uniref:F-box domain-containing protein n=1 Tax=Lophium mytilinum TaxID=390894 RepID=A0A6A6R1Q2_9PEZI|nr:hypothetical protein BU16DRAFT_579353 [Lophium mytilinum]
MPSTLNLCRGPGRTLSIQPCASVEGGCELHRFGRNQPCLEAVMSTGTSSSRPAATASIFFDNLSRSLSTFPRVPFSIVPSLRIPGNVRQTSKKNCNAGPKVPPFLNLPVELLQAISLFLPESSFVSLTLTCTGLAVALGTQPWTSLTKSSRFEDPDDDEEYQNLLILLQRDRPSYRLCKPCGTIHSPRASTVSIPRNVLTKRNEPPSILRHTALYFLEPGLWQESSYPINGNEIKVVPGMKDRIRRPAYWVSRAHIEAAIASRICLATLSCKAKYAIPITLYDNSLDDGSSSSLDTLLEFEYEVTPLRVRRKLLLFKTTFTFRFVTKDPNDPEQRRLDAVGKQHEVSMFNTMVKYVDMRPCVHAPSDLLVDEVLCLLFHQTMGAPHQTCVVCERAIVAERDRNGSGSGSNAATTATVAAPPNAAAPMSTALPVPSSASDGDKSIPTGHDTAGMTKGDQREEAQRRLKQEAWYSGRSCDCIRDYELSLMSEAPQNGESNHRIDNVEVKIWNLFGEQPVMSQCPVCCIKTYVQLVRIKTTATLHGERDYSLYVWGASRYIDTRKDHTEAVRIKTTQTLHHMYKYLYHSSGVPQHSLNLRRVYIQRVQVEITGILHRSLIFSAFFYDPPLGYFKSLSAPAELTSHARDLNPSTFAIFLTATEWIPSRIMVSNSHAGLRTKKQPQQAPTMTDSVPPSLTDGITEVSTAGPPTPPPGRGLPHVPGPDINNWLENVAANTPTPPPRPADVPAEDTQVWPHPPPPPAPRPRVAQLHRPVGMDVFAFAPPPRPEPATLRLEETTMRPGPTTQRSEPTPPRAEPTTPPLESTALRSEATTPRPEPTPQRPEPTTPPAEPTPLRLEPTTPRP